VGKQIEVINGLEKGTIAGALNGKRVETFIFKESTRAPCNPGDFF